MARQSLGRGLSALLGDESSGPLGPLEIDVDLIEPNPEQPRSRFDDVHLDELSRSIRANGVVQPIVVRKHGGRYQIIAGERRWRATQKAGLRKIPAVIKDIPDDKLLELALVENIQRQELNAIEEANAYRKLVDHVGLTQEMLADRVGKDRTAIATSMRLLKLPNDIQRYIVEGGLSAGHGRALLMTDDPKVQRAVAIIAIDMGLSVRETEKTVKRAGRAGSQTSEKKAVTATVDPNVTSAETKLMRHLSTKVNIVPSGRRAGGKIEIEYYNNDDLDRIYQLLSSK
ncbi:MAG: ParB/RepB/Spo0J family partition protein [Acidobacteriota bacterium]